MVPLERRSRRLRAPRRHEDECHALYEYSSEPTGCCIAGKDLKSDPVRIHYADARYEQGSSTVVHGPYSVHGTHTAAVPRQRRTASSAMADNFGEHVDVGTFSQILELDDSPQNRDFSNPLVYDYFTQAKETFEKMDEALRAKDLNQLSDLGHFLKGSSATLGFSTVRDHCQVIQQYGRGTTLDGSAEPDQDVCLQRITDALAAAKLNMTVIEEKMNAFFNQS
ncbi:phosphotransmitter protein [Grosmannia clavigera kw1407]|uniref:Phosphotransmitter protein n=1 Tax=Grosmannia clavigera (strain kw1407 / UAMH 11150) TaxID=655863 RepID=F0XTK9_GROCL|nr:phosphotransmitter protein [Grosmannia clavigera kw1407]EFW98891.1 phosphotransmitter protein [Grosmannia clavigera kw1407]